MTYFWCAAVGLLLTSAALAVIPEANAPGKTEPAPCPPTRTLVLERIGDRDLVLHLFAVDGAVPAGGRPAIVYLHGGGWGGGKPELLFPHARFFAGRGAVGCVPSYRLTSQAGVTLDDCIRDTRAAVSWLRAHAAEVGVDPAKIVVLGESAGGHLAALSEGPVAARILINPVLDLAALKWCATLPGIKGTPDAAARLARLSPITGVGPGMPPTLLVHGEDDSVVPIEQAERYAAAMAAAKNRCDFVRLPNVRHAFFIHGYGPDATVARGQAEIDRFLTGLGLLRTP
jgi:acetyl esterase